MTHTSPLSAYQERVQSAGLQPDQGQAEAMVRLDHLFHAIAAHQTPVGVSGLGRLFSRSKKTSASPPKGLYLYGGVGRGKTLLMDMFAEVAKPLSSQRFHFHDFMVQAQNAIQSARQAGRSDPIDSAADQLIAAGPVICFDEMEVRDIADAMIIRRLFLALWDKGMILVTTSNRPPELLYLDGLHRDRFLPFIDDLNTRLNVHEIGSGQDWRSAFLQSVSGWHLQTGPHDEAVYQALTEIFDALAGGAEVTAETMHFAGRSLQFDRVAGGVVDTSFDSLCRQPLGVRDYLAMADRFSGLILRDIPVLDDVLQNEARRFMWLVDALYDRGRFMIASAEAQVDELYRGDRWAFEFDRTCSRLQEMARLRGISFERQR